MSEFYNEIHVQGFFFQQGNVFFKEGETEESFWDVVEDEKFEVKEPDSKRQRTTE